jgi:hypothetical protein
MWLHSRHRLGSLPHRRVRSVTDKRSANARIAATVQVTLAWRGLVGINSVGCCSFLRSSSPCSPFAAYCMLTSAAH